MKYFQYVLCGFLFLSTNGFAAFVDIDVTHPYFYGIEYLHQNDIIEGYQSERGAEFRSFLPVLRSEALKMILLSSGTPLVPHARGGVFTDITDDQWHTPYIVSAYNEGIVSGFPDGTFQPGYTVSRAEFLKMLFLSFKAPVVEGSGSGWYEPFFEKAIEWNILEESQTDPTHKMTRGEVAESIYRLSIIASEGFESPYSFRGFGESSYYGFEFANRSTANGEVYDPLLLTAAHRTLPFGTYLRVTHDGKSVVVRVNDRGPYHNKRVLDLSQRAFETLAPLSRGVIDITFEVVSGPDVPKPEIPDNVLSVLDTESQQILVPDSVSAARENNGDRSGRQVLFDETIAHIPTDFFPGLQLRRTFPRIIPRGIHKIVSGRADRYGYRTIKIFLQPEDKKKDQIHFESILSGRNFEIPVSFLEEGKYSMGIVFDDQTRSRVETIEVRTLEKKRWFSSADMSIHPHVSVGVLPEDQAVSFSWKNEERSVVTRIDIEQGQKKETLYIEDNQESISVPYSFFEFFNENQDITISFVQALSSDGTLQSQTSNWKEVRRDSFVLWQGFEDLEKESIALTRFQRYYRPNSLIRWEGRRTNEDVQISDTAYVQRPSGIVEEIPLQTDNTDGFVLEWNATEEGVYVFQVNATNADTLLKRAVYVSANQVLPVKPWIHTPLSNNALVGVRDWINTVRYQYNRPALMMDESLQVLAQEYADHLAEHRFLSHTDIKGRTFRTRLEGKNMVGEFGENLSMADTLERALWGLETSLSHRYNLLLRRWKKVGIGVATIDGEVYVVQLFGE